MGTKTTSRQQFEEAAERLSQEIRKGRSLANRLTPEDGSPEARLRAKRLRMKATRDENWLDRFVDMLDAD